MSPLSKAKILQNSDARQIYVKEQRKQVLDLEAGTPINSVLDQRAPNPLATMIFMDVVTDFGRVTESHSPRAIRTQATPPENDVIVFCHPDRVRIWCMVTEPLAARFHRNRRQIGRCLAKEYRLIVDIYNLR
jgi:hypothetical protein